MNSEQVRVMYRNLVKSKQLDASGRLYVYSYCLPSGKNLLGKGNIDKTIGQGGYEYGTAYMTNCTPVVTDRKYAVRRTQTREVFAYIVGTVSAPIQGKAIRLTFNPFKDDHYSIKATGEMLPSLSRYRAIKFAPDITYGIL